MTHYPAMAACETTLTRRFAVDCECPTQLSIITGCHRSNISKEMYKLNKANLVNKTGDKWSLKQL